MGCVALSKIYNMIMIIIWSYKYKILAAQLSEICGAAVRRWRLSMGAPVLCFAVALVFLGAPADDRNVYPDKPIQAFWGRLPRMDCTAFLALTKS